ncbi:hypothetical protein MUP59_02100 [Candidatus Bathyarchaeota archaeon]|nr:hypothetical protein [Candidatus Bathyarchaeota archaeon]
MSSPRKDNIPLFPKPLEIKLADVLFFAVRKNLMFFKDLGNEHIHYSIFIRGSLIDFHKTFEDEHRHIPLAEIEFDWQFLMGRIFQEMRDNWRAIFQIVKTDDPQWADLEVEAIPVQVLMELLAPLVKGVRWNVDEKFLEKLESSVCCSRLGELSDGGLIIGTGSGFLFMSNGTECVLLDTDKISKIFEKSLESSVRKIRLNHFTPSSLIWYFRMRLLVSINSAIRSLRKL